MLPLIGAIGILVATCSTGDGELSVEGVPPLANVEYWLPEVRLGEGESVQYRIAGYRGGEASRLRLRFYSYGARWIDPEVRVALQLRDRGDIVFDYEGSPLLDEGAALRCRGLENYPYPAMRVDPGGMPRSTSCQWRLPAPRRSYDAVLTCQGNCEKVRAFQIGLTSGWK